MKTIAINADPIRARSFTEADVTQRAEPDLRRRHGPGNRPPSEDDE
jgi:hypothetical protein